MADEKMKTKPFPFLLVFFLLVALAGNGCRSIYYDTMETFGQHKRDILVRRVDDARESQEEAKEQFQSALQRFMEVTGFTGDELRQQYDRLETELVRSQNRAAAVSERIEAVSDVAEDLFGEWEAELELYTDKSLRKRSEDQLEQTRDSYERVLNSMQAAESRMDPVLNAFRDRVLFLKHNLNAQAIASLEGTNQELQREIQILIAEMDQAISEANAFIEAMERSED